MQTLSAAEIRHATGVFIGDPSKDGAVHVQVGIESRSAEPASPWHGWRGRGKLSAIGKSRGHSMNQLTELLGRLQSGDAQARGALFAAAYAELHRLARSRLRDGGRNTLLDTTGLVHESFLKFVSSGELRAEDRRAFFAYASQVMRSVIVNSARDRLAQKRGGDWRPLTLSTQLADNVATDEETLLRVHEAMDALEQAEPRLAQVAQMRYFGGYSEQEIAETLGISDRTVQRDWEKARLILAAALQ
jgi:RNA polymerase sigma factor (TIGR02999 family)